MGNTPNSHPRLRRAREKDSSNPRQPHSATAGELRRQLSEKSFTSAGGSELDPLCVLPPEVSLAVFQFVPVADIVCTCRLVCREWRRFFDDASFWFLRMIKGGNFDPRLRDLVGIPGINWPKLCVRVYREPNLLQNFVAGELSLQPWRLDYSPWEQFCQMFRPDQADRHRPRWGGGNGWHIETGCVNPDTEKQLVEENGGQTKNYVTSYEWCCREQVIDLASCGFVLDILDQLQPTIEVSEWFCARNDCGSIFQLRVDLLDKKFKSVQKFEFSERTEQWQGGRLGWRRVEHQFRDYGRGVQYLRFADGGKDTQWWAGHYGSKMAGARVRVKFQSD